MPGAPKAPSGILIRKTSMRPPLARPQAQRAQSGVPSLPPRLQPGNLSPPESVISSQSRSPTHRNPLKRKERDFDHEGGEETNIHVVVRCRGRNEREVRENSGVVVTTEGVRGKNVELAMGPSALSNKTFHFDKVFAPAADQAMIFDDVVAPLLNEILLGYNCTIFAYGQTGTGKTYTMSGDMSNVAGLLSEHAGIIPRVLQTLFRQLETDDAEYSVKCSFIELYNEELRDLLTTDEHTKLKIFEDGQKKGHSATIVQGMEESHIKSAAAGVKLLQDGSQRRQVAATKCNDLSSRSHTVFTVTVYIKRTSETGEDFVSAGKLNLVDLAGSENIQRSGAENKRAVEAGLINKSLLTLGRVITALVDRSSHIPYRESKLTRLLQDSLGGRTRTCIVATISPAKSNLDETLSTLDYAFRAKNIRNKPQVNQTISKKTLLREFTAEIEKLKMELLATRQRNGIYLTNENYEEMTAESESRRVLNEEQQAKIETMEANLRNKVQELFVLTNTFSTLKRDNEIVKQALDASTEILERTEIVLADTKQNLADETILRKAHQVTEDGLYKAGTELLSTLNHTVRDVGGLQAKILRKVDLQSSNQQKWKESQQRVSKVTALVEKSTSDFENQQSKELGVLAYRVQSYVQMEVDAIVSKRETLEQKYSTFRNAENEVLAQASTAGDEMNDVLEEIKELREEVKQNVGNGLERLSGAAQKISAGVIKELEEFHTQLHTSYSSLGRDIKAIFEDLANRLHDQKSEADELRRQLSLATNALAEKNAATSARLDIILIEERKQAALERQEFLSKLVPMFNEMGEAQDTRWSKRISAVREDMAAARSTFHESESCYKSSMDSWSERESVLVSEVRKSRETLKGKMKTDWTAVNEHNSTIRTTTEAIHNETIRVVDAQMKEMATQMQALDAFVTRARLQNESHHASHVESLRSLGSSAAESSALTRSHLASSQQRTQDFEKAWLSYHTQIQTALPALDTDISIRLSQLRDTIAATPFTEYMPTGETPQKQAYTYPTVLPQTAPHAKILSHSKSPTKSASPSLSSNRSDPAGYDSAPVSPSKALVYTDTPPSAQNAGFARTTAQDLLAQQQQQQQRPSSADSLREIPVNVQLFSQSVGSGLPVKMSSEGGAEKDALAGSLMLSMGPPPLKRLATESSRVPVKGPRRGEGRENVVGGGRGRKLRSSANS